MDYGIISKLFLLLLITFSVLNVTAEQQLVNTTLDDTQSSGIAMSSGTGDLVNTTSSITITNDTASGYAITESIAFNGSNATAEAEVKTNFLDKAVSYAYSKAEGISEIGETVYVYAISLVSSSSNSEASSQSYAIVSEKQIDTSIYINLNSPNEENKNNEKNKNNPELLSNSKLEGQSSEKVESKNIAKPTNKVSEIKIKVYGNFGGFNFGNSSVQRYCVYKVQVQNKDVTLDSVKRSVRLMDYIATDIEGYRNSKEFEERYNITYNNCVNFLINSPNVTENRIK